MWTIYEKGLISIWEQWPSEDPPFKENVPVVFKYQGDAETDLINLAKQEINSSEDIDLAKAEEITGQEIKQVPAKELSSLTKTGLVVLWSARKTKSEIFREREQGED